MNKSRIESAIKIILEEIGENTEREGLIETPKRVANMLEEITVGLRKSPKEDLEKVFTVEHNNLVLVKDISFYSLCEHHLIPFFGKVHIGYIPSNNKVLGLSKLARLVKNISQKPQLQERITEEIVYNLKNSISCEGIMVLVEAEHLCMSMRGIETPSSKTITIEKMGVFQEDTSKSNEFLKMIDY